jgi:hypothetical protein
LHDAVGVILQEEEIMKCLFRITSHDHGTLHPFRVERRILRDRPGQGVVPGSAPHDHEELAPPSFSMTGKVRIDTAIPTSREN